MENNQTDINVLIKRRYEELDELRNKGIETFAYSFDTDAYSEDIKNDFGKFENKDEALKTINILKRKGLLPLFGSAMKTQ